MAVNKCHALHIDRQFQISQPQPNHLLDRNIRTRQVDLRSLVRVPLERQQGMLGGVVRKLNLLGHSVTPSDGSITRVQLRIIHTLTLGIVESIAREPVLAPARLTLRAVGAVVALLSINIRAGEHALLEAVFCSLLLLFRRGVAGVQELVDDGLVLADAVGEHAPVVSVVVHTPHNLDLLAGGVRFDHISAPVTCWHVVVGAYSGIVPANTAASDFGLVERWPSGYGLQDGAFRAGVVSRL